MKKTNSIIHLPTAEEVQKYGGGKYVVYKPQFDIDLSTVTTAADTLAAMSSEDVQKAIQHAKQKFDGLMAKALFSEPVILPLKPPEYGPSPLAASFMAYHNFAVKMVSTSLGIPERIYNPTLGRWLRSELERTINFWEADLDAIRDPWYGIRRRR